jgi:transposase
MFQDEARFGLISDARHCWCHAPERPVCPITMSHKAVYVYAAVSIGSGQVDSLILPQVDTVCMQLFLDEIAHRYPDEKLVMVLDNAGWHLGKGLEVPKNMRLLSLPPYSPELNPMENIWEDLREKSFHNKTFKDLDEMEQYLLSALYEMEASPERTKSICKRPASTVLRLVKRVSESSGVKRAPFSVRCPSPN